MPTKREVLYSDTVGPQLGSFPSSSKTAVEFFFPTHKTGAGKRRGFSPTASLPVPVRSPFRPHLLFTQSYFFRKHIFSNILLTGPLALRKFRDREDPAPSFPPAGQALLLAPEDGQLELLNETKGHNTPWGQVLKAFQRKAAPNRSSSPPICSSSAKDLLALAVN